MRNASEQAVNANAGIPLFYLGDDPTFRPLARRLSTHQEFQGLNIERPIVGQIKNPHSLRRIAEHFVKMIRERQLRGPYTLGGWYAHGLLALEAAQQLREQGQTIALLVLLETINPERLRQQPRWIRGIAHWHRSLTRRWPENPTRSI
jgi:thioesterase domain-containing protein